MDIVVLARPEAVRNTSGDPHNVLRHRRFEFSPRLASGTALMPVDPSGPTAP